MGKVPEGSTIFVWNDLKLVVKQIPLGIDNTITITACDEIRDQLHGTGVDDPRWQVHPGHLMVEEILLNEEGERSIFDDVDK